jgi:hypothetical protein
MFIVMLILLVATALATIALQTTQAELRAAGSNRMSVQTQYIAENGLVSTLSYADAMATQDKFACAFLSVGKPRVPPNMYPYGETEVPQGYSFFSVRSQWFNQKDFLKTDLPDFPPLSLANGVDTGGVVSKLQDTIGTLGPQAAYRPGDAAVFSAAAAGNGPVNPNPDYVVDFYDCKKLPAYASPGNPVDDSNPYAPYYCVVTSRGRSFLPNGLTKTWDLTYGGKVLGGPFALNRFSSAHDARTTIITGPTLWKCPVL